MSRTQPTQIDAASALATDTRARTRTMTPGVVVAYDEATNTAEVQPAIGGVDAGTGTPVVLPVLSGVPVWWPRGAGLSQRSTLLPGDAVVLIVSDRSIDDWLLAGAPVPGRRQRMHELSDAIALAGFPAVPTTATLPLSGGRWIVSRDDGQAYLAISGPSAGAPAAVVEGTPVQLGAAAALGVNRVGDTVVPSAAMTAWALVVETAINVLAPGTFTPANSFAGTVAAAFANTGPGSAKVLAE